MAKTLPKPGTYKARRNSPIVVNESENGALMAWFDARLLDADISFSLKHGLCLGKTDGTLMTKAFDTLHKVFPAWQSNNPFELSEIEIPEGDAPEFILADCYIDDSYTPPDADAPVLQFKARWFNALDDSRLPEVTPDEAEAIQKKWSVKWNAIGGKAAPTATKTATAKPAKTPAAAPAEKKTAPKKPAKAIVWDGASVYIALLKKNEINTTKDKDGDDEADPKTPAATLDPVVASYWDAQEELFGKGAQAETAEQWLAVAEKLELV